MSAITLLDNRSLDGAVGSPTTTTATTTATPVTTGRHWSIVAIEELDLAVLALGAVGYRSEDHAAPVAKTEHGAVIGTDEPTVVAARSANVGTGGRRCCSCARGAGREDASCDGVVSGECTRYGGRVHHVCGVGDDVCLSSDNVGGRGSGQGHEAERGDD